jgi:hypothetical protein
MLKGLLSQVYVRTGYIHTRISWYPGCLAMTLQRDMCTDRHGHKLTTDMEGSISELTKSYKLIEKH